MPTQSTAVPAEVQSGSPPAVSTPEYYSYYIMYIFFKIYYIFYIVIITIYSILYVKCDTVNTLHCILLAGKCSVLGVCIYKPWAILLSVLRIAVAC